MGVTHLAGGGSPAQSADETGAVVVRLSHPDRQAAEVLRLFEGARASSPAAALSAWKQARPGSSPLGKPLEAVLALFNPDMVREWRVVHEAELDLDLNAAEGTPRWFAIIPHDDGTAAAALTAARLTDPDEPPLIADGREIPVARLGRSGVPVACQVGPALIVGSLRAELLRGLRRRPIERPPAEREWLRPLDSGISFQLIPERVPRPRGGSLGLRRAVEVLHAIGGRRLEGSLALHAGELRLAATTVFEKAPPPRPAGSQPAVVDPAWLEGIPSSHVMAVAAVAIDPDPASWDRVFAVADRVERVDPARDQVAPLRTRLNLMAAAVGMKPEADLWPHLRGITACVLGNSKQPGRPTGAWLILHLDEESTAEQFVREFAPGLARLLPAGKPGHQDPRVRPEGEPGTGAPSQAPRRLGTVLGRELTVRRRGRSVLLAWGGAGSAASSTAQLTNERSLAAVCCGWGREGKGPPQRLGAFWPGRLWRPSGGLKPSPESLRALSDDPPAVWWGWTDSNQALDSIRWPELSQRVHRFLETIPLDPPRVGPERVTRARRSGPN